MEIGSIIDILQRSTETAGLRVGDLLRIKVVEVFEDQRILVDLGRWRTMAVVRFPVAVGDEFLARVQDASGQLRLQRIELPEAAGSAVGPIAGPVQGVSAQWFSHVRPGLEALADAWMRLPESRPVPQNVRQALEALLRFVVPFDLESTPAALAARIREVCENSGVFLECRLGSALEAGGEGPQAQPLADPTSAAKAGRVLADDLKARLLLLNAFLEGSDAGAIPADRGAAAGLSREVGEALALIRSGQEQMGNRPTAEQPFLMLHVALPLTDEREAVRLKVAYRRRSIGPKQEGHRAAVLLTLDHLGSVRSDLYLLGQSLSIFIFVASDELQNVFTQYASELRDALAAGFDSVRVQVKTSPRKIERFLTEDWRPAGESLVDVRV
jgi:hypothetical protein